MKLSELGNDIGAIREQVNKVFGEQRQLLDQANAKIKSLEESANNADVPEEVSRQITELKSLISRVDDQVPDDAGTEQQPQG